MITFWTGVFLFASQLAVAAPYSAVSNPLTCRYEGVYDPAGQRWLSGEYKPYSSESQPSAIGPIQNAGVDDERSSPQAIGAKRLLPKSVVAHLESLESMMLAAKKIKEDINAAVAQAELDGDLWLKAESQRKARPARERQLQLEREYNQLRAANGITHKVWIKRSKTVDFGLGADVYWTWEPVSPRNKSFDAQPGDPSSEVDPYK